MAEPDRPQSPFAGMADLSVRTPVRVLSPDEIERMLAEHRLYLETEYHRGTDFTGAHLQRANFVGAILQEACFDRADLSRARLSGADLVFGQFRERLPRQGRDGVRRGSDPASLTRISSPGTPNRRCRQTRQSTLNREYA
jgi:Pentapeptide repeats (8 copies)